MTLQAIWHDTVLAESDDTVFVERNHYFPIRDIHWEFFEQSTTHTICSWKGTASYLSVVVDGERNTDAAWYYPDPSPAANQISGRVAFWRGVKIVRSDVGTQVSRRWRKLPQRSA